MEHYTLSAGQKDLALKMPTVTTRAWAFYQVLLKHLQPVFMAKFLSAFFWFSFTLPLYFLHLKKYLMFSNKFTVAFIKRGGQFDKMMKSSLVLKSDLEFDNYTFLCIYFLGRNM